MPRQPRYTTADVHDDLLALSDCCSARELGQIFGLPTGIVGAALRQTGARRVGRPRRRSPEEEAARTALIAEVLARRVASRKAGAMSPSRTALVANPASAAGPVAPQRKPPPNLQPGKWLDAGVVRYWLGADLVVVYPSADGRWRVRDYRWPASALLGGQPSFATEADSVAAVERSAGRPLQRVVLVPAPAPLPVQLPLPAARPAPPLLSARPAPPPADNQPVPPLAKRIPTPKGERRSRIDPFADLVGVRPDAEVARLAGVTRSSVIAYRQTRAIPVPPPLSRPTTSGTPRRRPSLAGPQPERNARPAERAVGEAPEPRTPTGRRLRRSKLDAFLSVMGTRPDHEIATMAGMNRKSVVEYRVARGISASGRVTRAASERVVTESGPGVDVSETVEPQKQVPAETPEAVAAAVSLPATTNTSTPAPLETGSVSSEVAEGPCSGLSAPVHRPDVPADADVSGRVGVGTHERRGAGHPAPPRGRPSKLAPHAHLIGVEPDHIAATLAGVGVAAVVAHRKARGVASPVVASSPPNVRPPVGEPDPPPTFAEVPPRGRGSVLDDHRDIVGVLSDDEVAVRVGVTRQAVAQYRALRRIPAPPRPARAKPVHAPPPPAKPKIPSRVDPFRSDLGVLLDTDIADLAGVSTTVVQKYRTRLGIPRAPVQPGRPRRPRSREARAPAPLEAAAVVGADESPTLSTVTVRAGLGVAATGRLVTRGYYILAERDGQRVRHVVLAADIAEAMRTATRSLVEDAGWRIIRGWDAGEVLTEASSD